jgi:hypothetical protein
MGQTYTSCTNPIHLDAQREEGGNPGKAKARKRQGLLKRRAKRDHERACMLDEPEESGYERVWPERDSAPDGRLH